MILKPKQKSEISFIRHGQSEANVRNVLAGQEDVPLSDIGREQAHAAGRKLREEGVHFDAIASSPLQRANETARIIADEVGYDGGIPTMLELMERDGGSFQGKDLQEFYDATNDEIIAAGGESLEDFSERVGRASTLLGAFAVGKVLVVGHAEAYRMMYAHARGLSPESYLTVERPQNAQIYPFPRTHQDQVLHDRITRIAKRHHGKWGSIVKAI